MSDDWAKNYIGIHRQRQQEKQDAQERTRLARVGAPDMFQRMKNRVRQDLQTLHDAGVVQSLGLSDDSTESFSVGDTGRTLSNPSLVVELEIILVKYQHLFSPPKGGKDNIRKSVGALRICSDLNGVIRVYQNGSEQAFADESDISEFLLRPLLDFVDG
jgi:hypothetical protein